MTTNPTSGLDVDSEIDLTSMTELESSTPQVIVNATPGTVAGRAGTSPEHVANNPGAHDALEVGLYGKLAE